MFVDNRLGGPVRLARALLRDDVPVASLNVLARYALRGGRLELTSFAADGALASALVDPLWKGTSVCAVGSVPGPAKPPYQTEVTLRIAGHAGRRELRLVVSGDRRWARRGGELVSTPPEPFDALPLTADVAYGGFVDLPPGPAPGTGLPRPGLRVAFPLNPGGKGFCLAAEAAEGVALPNLEWHDARIQVWSDRPEPACLAPCPDLALLRVDTASLRAERLDVQGEQLAQFVPQALRALHVGHGRCIVDELLPDARIELVGATLGHVGVTLPPAPFSVFVRRRGVEHAIRSRVRAVLIDVTTDAVDVVWGAALTWPARTLGGDMRVERAAA